MVFIIRYIGINKPDYDVLTIHNEDYRVGDIIPELTYKDTNDKRVTARNVQIMAIDAEKEIVITETNTIDIHSIIG